MPIKCYEMTDSQWEQIKALFPTAKAGCHGKVNRMVFNAILWIAGTLWLLEDRVQPLLQMA